MLDSPVLHLHRKKKKMLRYFLVGPRQGFASLRLNVASQGKPCIRVHNLNEIFVVLMQNML